MNTTVYFYCLEYQTPDGQQDKVDGYITPETFLQTAPQFYKFRQELFEKAQQEHNLPEDTKMVLTAFNTVYK
jgi:hypothetical protein